jgi:PII-like signaling protein
VIELVDDPEKIRPFIATLKQMLDDGMMTIESVVIIYQHAGSPRS